MAYARQPGPVGHVPASAGAWHAQDRQVFGAAATAGPVDAFAPLGPTKLYGDKFADQFSGGRLGAGRAQTVHLRRPGQPKGRSILSSVLTLGNSGDQVRQLQQLLNGRLEPSAGLLADGVFGPKTLAAVMQFQQGSTLRAHGKVERDTWFNLLFGDTVQVPQQAQAKAPRSLVNAAKPGIPS